MYVCVCMCLCVCLSGCLFVKKVHKLGVFNQYIIAVKSTHAYYHHVSVCV